MNQDRLQSGPSGGSKGNTQGDGGSTPHPLTWPKLTLGQHVGLAECPYLRRWVVDFGAFALRLHRWEHSDDERAFHDHPWWFLTVVLIGSYVDLSPAGEDRLRAGSVRFRSSAHRHTVKVLRPGTWSLLVTGPAVRRWGFWVKDRLVKRDKYFATRGHHPCGEDQAPVRQRPDGSRVGEGIK